MSSSQRDPLWRTARRGAARILATAAIGLTLLAAPTAARAEEDVTTDGRLEGYGSRDPGGEGNVSNVALAKSGTGGTWIIFMLLSVLGCSVLFKNANRSHLD